MEIADIMGVIKSRRQHTLSPEIEMASALADAWTWNVTG
jgi:hypothetical protein